MNNKIAIGIISYLPDNETRENRINKLKNLISRCSELFPRYKIIIIAQNWKEFQLDNNDNIWVVDFDKPLGIVGARRALRRAFLDYTNFDYLIMLDDDCELRGKSSKEYIKQIEENPNCFIEFNKTLLKLFAISRKIFEQVDFDEDVNPENGDGFEDRIFVNKLRIMFPESRREFIGAGLEEYSISTKDPNSTWYRDQNIQEMLAKTQEKIQKIN